MLTIENLTAYGADAAAGLARCMNNENFYFRMIKLGSADTKFQELGRALESGDLAGAFELAHALKGVTANLSLTPLYEPLSEMTELLRARTDMDYTALYRRVTEARQALLALLE